jgi:PAS domain S-box-containing protein
MAVRASSIHIGLVGIHAGLETFLRDCAEHAYGELYPEFDLTGIVGAGQKIDASLLDDLDMERVEDVPTLLMRRPETNVLAVLEDDPELLARVRSEIPPSVSLVDARVVSIFEDLVSRENLCPTCQSDLSTVQSMLRAVLDEVTDDILFVDTQGKILDVNKNVCARLGRSREFFLGKPREIVWEGDTKSWDDQYGDPFDQALRTTAKSEGMHVRIDSQGRFVYYRVYVYPIVDRGSKVTSFLEMHRDISKRTHMEKQLQQSEKMAALGELAAYIAHEIRNPLVSIGGFAGSLLKNDSLSESVQKKIRIILDESKRLDTILRGILNFARPTPQKQDAVEVNRIVEETMQVMGMGCEKQGVRLKMDLTRDLASVHGRAEAIKQSLINVVKNGIESMDKGGELTVSTRDGESYVCIEVTDTGTGIEEEHLEHIFSPFFSTKETGSGLGLAMTKKIIEEMGGSVEVYSRKGQGTTMALLLRKK